MADAIFLVGISGSGKSTLAQKLCDDYWAVELNRDAIRFSEIDPGGDWTTYKFTPENEERVTGIWMAKAKDFSKNSSIIVSDTNVSLKPLKKNLQFFRKNDRGAQFIIMDIPYAECLRRDRLRGKFSVGYQVIDKQYDKFIQTFEWIQQNYPENWINYSQFCRAHNMFQNSGY